MRAAKPKEFVPSFVPISPHLAGSRGTEAAPIRRSCGQLHFTRQTFKTSEAADAQTHGSVAPSCEPQPRRRFLHQPKAQTAWSPTYPSLAAGVSTASRSERVSVNDRTARARRPGAARRLHTEGVCGRSSPADATGNFLPGGLAPAGVVSKKASNPANLRVWFGHSREENRRLQPVL